MDMIMGMSMGMTMGMIMGMVCVCVCGQHPSSGVVWAGISPVEDLWHRVQQYPPEMGIDVGAGLVIVLPVPLCRAMGGR